MKTATKIAPLMSLGVMTLSLWAVAATEANARPPQSASSAVSRTGPAGNTSTRQSNVATNGQGGYTAGSTFTAPNGQSASREQSGSYNAATQTYSRAGSTTGPNDRQSNFTSSTTATANGYVHSSTHTGPNGQSVTSQGQASFNPSTGTINQSRTTIGPNGQSATESRIVTVN